MTIRRKDGALNPDRMQITPVAESNGAVIEDDAVKHDIRKRRNAERAMGHSPDFAQSTIDALSSHICVLDERGTIIAVNKAWREFSRANSSLDLDGVLPQTLSQDSCYEGVNYLAVCDRAQGTEAEESAKFAAGIRSVLHGECERFSADYSCHSSAERRWFVGRVTRFVDNRLPRILIEHIDITDRRQTEEALLFKTALLEGQTETTIDGILAVDESDRIVLANKQFGRIFGVPTALLKSGNDLLVRKHVTDMVSDPDAFLEKVQYLYGHREQKSRDEIILKDGKTLDRYSAPLVDSRSEYRGRIWYFRDITDRKAAEERSRFLAYHDALTGLPHRTLLLDRLDTALASVVSQADRRLWIAAWARVTFSRMSDAFAVQINGFGFWL